MAIDINRGTSGINLPFEVSNEIWSKTQEASAIMGLASPMELPGSGVEVDIIAGDPEANWVGETEEIAVSEPAASSKKIKGYKMGIIMAFSNEFRRDKARLFDEMIARAPMKIAEKFDATCFGKVAKPGELFDNFSGCDAVDVVTDPWAGLVACDAKISEANAVLNGWCISPKYKSILLNEKDGDGRPLFVPSVSADSLPPLIGSPTRQSRNAYVAGTPNMYGVAGNWASARYGIVQGMTMSVSDQTTLKIGGEQVNLWQRDMFALKLTFEVGFRLRYEDEFVRMVDKAN